MLKPSLLDPVIDAASRWLRATERVLRPVYLTQGDRLIKAAEDNDLVRVNGLLAAGVDPNAKVKGGDAYASNDVGLTPLHHAVRHGNAHMVLVLLHAGADPNAPRTWGETPWWEWLEKHKTFAYSRHPNPLPPPLPESEHSIGVALLVHGASMDSCVPPFRPDRTIASMVHGPHRVMVEALQDQVRATREHAAIAAVTPNRSPSRPRPRI